MNDKGKDEAFFWKKNGTGLTLVSSQINDRYVIIPCAVQEQEVTAIGPKAFLSNKRLESLEIPFCVEEIGDWAFAHAGNLQRLRMYGKEGPVRLGRNVFLGCSRLREILFENDTYIGTGHLRAAAVRVLQATEFFVPESCTISGGSFGVEGGRVDFFTAWDGVCSAWLKEPDLKGFQPMWAGGEEDYESEQEQRKLHAGKRKREKVSLCYLRLIYDRQLTREKREEFLAYLSTGWEAAWNYLLTEHLQEKEYYRVLSEAGLITGEYTGQMLQDMERAGAAAELRAYVLNCAEKQRIAEEVFFHGLQL